MHYNQINDHKSATRREEEIKYINGIKRDDVMRTVYQQNGNTILKRIEQFNNENRMCKPINNIHKYPTRVTPSSFAEELKAYNQRALQVPQPDPTSQTLRFNATKIDSIKCNDMENYKMSNY